jgi:hypothetical protein
MPVNEKITSYISNFLFKICREIHLTLIQKDKEIAGDS